jgi:hypothetical protein
MVADRRQIILKGEPPTGKGVDLMQPDETAPQTTEELLARMVCLPIRHSRYSCMTCSLKVSM